MGILSTDLNNINLDDVNGDDHDDDDPKTIIHVRLLAWLSKFEKKTLKKNKWKINAYSMAS